MAEQAPDSPPVSRLAAHLARARQNPINYLGVLGLILTALGLVWTASIYILSQIEQANATPNVVLSAQLQEVAQDGPLYVLRWEITLRNAGSNRVSILDSASRVVGSTISYSTATPSASGDGQSEYIDKVDHNRIVAYGEVSHTSRYYSEDSASTIDAGRFVESGISLGPGQQKTMAFLVYTEDRYQILKLQLTVFAARHGWDGDAYDLEVDLNPTDGGLTTAVLQKGRSSATNATPAPAMAASQARRYVDSNTVQSDLVYEVSQAAIRDRAISARGPTSAAPTPLPATPLPTSASPSPTPPARPATPTPTAPTGSGIQKGVQVQVIVPNSCLIRHTAPGVNASTGSLKCLTDGTVARVEDGPITVSGHPWWKLDTGGWVIVDYLKLKP